MFSCEFYEILKRLIFKTSAKGYFWRVIFFAVASFRKASGIHHEQYRELFDYAGTARDISLKITERSNKFFFKIFLIDCFGKYLRNQKPVQKVDDKKDTRNASVNVIWVSS